MKTHKLCCTKLMPLLGVGYVDRMVRLDSEDIKLSFACRHQTDHADSLLRLDEPVTSSKIICSLDQPSIHRFDGILPPRRRLRPQAQTEPCVCGVIYREWLERIDMCSISSVSVNSKLFVRREHSNITDMLTFIDA